MRILLCAIFLFATIALSWGIPCHVKGECANQGMSCGIANILQCHQLHGLGIGTCTCESPHNVTLLGNECLDGYQCKAKHKDCERVLGLAMEWHCIDTHCKCLFDEFLNHIGHVPPPS